MPRPINLNRPRLIRTLSLFAAVLAVINIPMTLLEYRLAEVSWGLSNLAQCLTLDSENSIPAWFSSGLLFVCALSLGFVALNARARDDRWWKHWAALGGLFGCLSIDESVGFHEQLMAPIRGMLGEGMSSVFYFAWVIPGAAFVGIVGFAFLGFLRSLPLRTSLRFVGAGCVFVGGAIGLEVLGGWLFSMYGGQHLGYITVATLEESCEMFGLILFLRAILIHFEQTFGKLSFVVLPETPWKEAAGDRRKSRTDRRRPVGAVA